jgi:hypothetical protein
VSTEGETTMNYTVGYSYPTPISGYEPEYQAYRGASWEAAYEWALAQAEAAGQGTTYELRPGFDALYTALRDTAAGQRAGGEVRIETWTHRPYTVLGAPFTPERLATVTVTAEPEG